MSLHSSLKRAEKMGVSRSILKRGERIKLLVSKGAWKEGDKVVGLPKNKVIRLKAEKKEKAVKAADAAAPAAAGATPAAAAKTAAAPKAEAKKK